MNDDEMSKILDEPNRVTNRVGYENYWAQQKGFVNYADYRNWWAQQRGFTNYADYLQDNKFKRGIGTGLSMANSKDSALYLGIFVAERLLPDIFQEPKMMPHGNKGYDAICKNGHKINVKSSVLYKDNNWIFSIRQNKIADIFICIAFDNRIDLNVKHIWLIPGSDIIRSKKLNELKGLSIHNTEYSKRRMEKYELKDRLDKANSVCVLFKKGVLK